MKVSIESISSRVSSERRQVPFAALWPFLSITFGLAWGIFVLLVLFPKQLVELFGEVSGKNPLFVLAVYAPAIAAFVVVARAGGMSGLRRYLGRLLLWRCPLAWVAFVLVGIPLVFYGGAWLKGNLFQEPFPFRAWQPMLTAMLVTLFIGPIEEFGWRGVALPLLQQKFAPIWAALILGVIWGLWHLPAFFQSGTPQSAWPFAPFFAGSVALSVIVTAMFNASKGSILLPVLFHFQLNNPIFPDAQPYDSVLLVAVAVAVVWLKRDEMFSKSGAVTDVIPDVESDRKGSASTAQSTM
jgi:uncharacterized protein